MSSLDSTGSRVIELTKKKLFTPSQKEKIKRRSLLQAGIVENSENEVEDQRLKTILRVRPSRNRIYIRYSIDLGSELEIDPSNKGAQRKWKIDRNRVG